MTLAIQIDYTMGNFDLPIQFPGGTFLRSFSCVTYQAGIGAAMIEFGTQQGASDIFKFNLVPPPAASSPRPRRPPISCRSGAAAARYAPSRCG